MSSLDSPDGPNPFTDPNHAACAFIDITTATANQLEEIFGPRTHPDVADAIRIVHNALSVQRRQLARMVRAEANAVRHGDLAPRGPGDYAAGLHRAARLVEGGQRNS